MNDTIERGGISVETEHIFPIIKRWLYSDKEIFLRELVSNASDAITKMKRLVSLGEAKDPEEPYRITVRLDGKNKTLTVSDNGIGMTDEEIKRYINQIALSGALEFIEKYEGESSENGIIGHFGLGFYSAFMVADKVEILTKSYREDAQAMHWQGDETGEYEMRPGQKDARGTDVILHITEEEKEFLKKGKIEEVLRKYCSFLPVELYFETDEDTEKDEKKPVNDTSPLWQKAPGTCEEKEYNEFYKKVFGDFRDPLFYIHINADYPLNFKGILFFPRLTHEYANLEGQVKLFYNQVFVADNIKEVIPEYLLMLKGVLDCPELPLNVSRSFLQNSGYVSKISAHIIKKVCDKINALFTDEREKYQGFWDDIKPFVEYGCMRDKKFMEKVKDAVLFKTSDDSYLTLSEYLDKNRDKEPDTVYYASDRVQQSRYIHMLKEQGIDVVLLDTLIDTQFISHLEMENKQVKFVRCDSGVAATLKSDDSVVPNELLVSLFREAIGKEDAEVEFAALKNEKTPALLTISEQDRRFSDMMKLYTRGEKSGIPGSLPEKLTVNIRNPLITKIEALLADPDKKTTALRLARQTYMLAVISQRSLTGEELETYLTESTEFLTSI